MTEQEIFDTVVAHLRKQGRRATDKWNDCVYRAPNGDKCAVGGLISDDEYSADMEGSDVDWLSEQGKLPMRLEPHLDLLIELQKAHDHAGVNFTKETEADFISIAAHFNLTLEPRT